MKIAVASDLHLDPRGSPLTEPGKIEALAQEIVLESPDLLVLAGDLGHSLDHFERCLDCFSARTFPLAVVAGNHDVWRDRQRGLSSLELWRVQLPLAVHRAGGLWLEEESFEMNGVAVVGSMAWYDYSAIDPQFADRPLDHLVAFKRLVSADAHWIDWSFSDIDLATTLRRSLVERCRDAASKETVHSLVVVTHVPVLEEQMVRKPDDDTWGLSNAYFGHLTAGAELLGEPKLRAVVSGHTHVGKKARVERAGLDAVDAVVIDSDYERPGYTVIDV